jgi:DNA-directed RNA polymerase specialized sigma24 family protein
MMAKTENQIKRTGPRIAGHDGLKKSHYYDDEYYTGLWFEFFDENTSPARKAEIRDEIILSARLIAKGVIRTNHFYQFASEDDLLQEASLKVVRDFEKFNIHLKGKKPKAFNYLTTIIKHHLLTYISRARKHKFYTIPLDDFMTRSNNDPKVNEQLIATDDGSAVHTDNEVVPASFISSDSIAEQLRINSMINVLKLHPIGVAILAFIDAEIKNSHKKVKNTRKPTIKRLLGYLYSQGFQAKDCLQYLEDLQSGIIPKLPEDVCTSKELANVSKKIRSNGESKTARGKKVSKEGSRHKKRRKPKRLSNDSTLGGKFRNP